MLIPNGGEEFVGLMIVKLRFRSRSGEGQVKLRKLRKVRYLDLSYTLFLVFVKLRSSSRSGEGQVKVR